MGPEKNYDNGKSGRDCEPFREKRVKRPKFAAFPLECQAG